MIKNKTAWVLYYSNSGNTKNLADMAATFLVEKTWDVETINLTDFEPEKMKKPDLIVLGTPIHFWTIPKMAKEGIAKIPDLSSAVGFVFATYGNVFSSGVTYELAKELEKRGATVLGGASLVCPHNFMSEKGKRLGELYPEFGKDQPDDKTLEKYTNAIKDIAEKAEKNDKISFDINRLKSPNPFITFMDQFIPVEMEVKALSPVNFDISMCQDCGLCVKKCDTKSITEGPDKEKTINQNTCMRCYTCARGCPSGAMKVNWSKNENFLRLAKKIIKSPGSRIII